MDETQTQIAWPSKLKIGAKSKKGEVFCCRCCFYVLFFLRPRADPLMGHKRTLSEKEKDIAGGLQIRAETLY